MDKGGSAPTPPDPMQTAQAQSKFDKETAAYNAVLNRYNSSTPFGSQTWTQNGTDPTTGAPIYSQQINLTPDAQTAVSNSQKTQAGLSGLQNQALGGVADVLNHNPYDRNSLAAAPVNAGQTAQDAIMSRLQPQVEMENKQFDADMANKGIPVGSEAYNNARRTVAQSQNDRQIQAALQGINVAQQARQQGMQEQNFYATQPLNFLNGLMSGAQVQTPQFQATTPTNAAAPNYQAAAQNAYQGQLNAYNSQMGANNSLMSGLFSLGGAALGAPTGTFSSIFR